MKDPISPVMHPNELPAEVSSWGTVQWLCNTDLFPDCEMSMGLVRINAGEKIPEHVHADCEALIYVEAGECEQRIGKSWYHMTPGCMIRVPRGVPHQTVNLGPDNCRLICVHSSAKRDFKSLEDME